MVMVIVIIVVMIVAVMMIGIFIFNEFIFAFFALLKKVCQSFLNPPGRAQDWRSGCPKTVKTMENKYFYSQNPHHSHHHNQRYNHQ